MVKLRVKNFGPIKEGASDNDDFIEIHKVTVFIGEQGSGKSTVAKIYSTFLWLEKAFFCGFDIVSDFKTDDFITLCSNQLLPDSYFTEKTELEYIGDFCDFSFKNGKFSLHTNLSKNYTRPKIMYIPSERNLVSVLENVDGVKNLPVMLSLLQQEIKNAKKTFIPKISDKTSVLSLNNYFLKYDSANDSIIVIEKQSNVAVPLTMSSSGLQSVIPLITVVAYLAQETGKPILSKLKNLSSAEKELILNSIPDENLSKNMEIFFNSGLSAKTLEKEVNKNSTLFEKYLNMRLINIVEEPEQNLFPDFQKKIIESLILHTNQNKNQNSDNQLMITTHSPYVLGVLNNSIYAGKLTKLGKDCTSVIPVTKQIPTENISAYKIENGKIYSIICNETHLINNSEIDGCSEIINSDYQKLEDIEFE